MSYQSLFTPFSIGKMEVKNRLVMSPMGTNSSHIDGRKDAQEIDYFIERAKGGVGMIIMGCQPLTKELAQGSLEGTLDSYSVLPPLTSVCDSVHRYGTKIVCQVSAGTGRNAFPDNFGNPPMSASAIPSAFDENVICHALTKSEIKAILKSFEFAAGAAKDAGYDAIEIHAHAGYLIDQFMSAVWNKRTDEYGGSLENRARFPQEIIQSIRKAIGPDMPILFRISLDHRFPGGRTIEDSLPLLKLLEAAGVDAFDVDAGSYETLDYIFPPSYLGDSCMSYVCSAARKVVSVPLLNAGNHTPETAVQLIESGDADFVSFGRPLIADPYLPHKLQTEHREDIRPCIRCNENCIGRIWNRHTKLSCTVNPQAMEETHMQLHKTNNPKSIVVIGSGPAGMEAARVAALDGHQVTLYEKESHLGGVMGDVATADFKYKIAELRDWYQTQLEKLGVNIKLNTAINMHDSVLDECDLIIAGCGSQPLVPNIPGINHDNVISMLSGHRDETKIKGDHILICGGGSTGCDGALEIATEMHKQVTVIEMADEVAKDAFFINKITLMNRLEASNAKLLTNTKVLAIESDGVTVQTPLGVTEKLTGDTIINAFGMKPDLTLINQLKKHYYNKLITVGDSIHPGKIGDAIRSGFNAGASIA